MTASMPVFYITGGTLRDDAACYVYRRADEELYTCLLEGEYGYVLTSRQMGKSSLMVRTAARLRQAGATVLVADLSALGQNLTPEQWYFGLLGRMIQSFCDEAELEAFWRSHVNFSAIERWVQALERFVIPCAAGRVVIFIDEIDIVRSLPFSVDEFFTALRACYNRRATEPQWNRLSFCLIGAARTVELIRDPRMSPFNIGRAIELTDFTEAEAAYLAHGLPGTDIQRALLMKRVLYWTGGHPYLTQQLCQTIAQNPLPFHTGDVNRHCERLFLTRQARDVDNNLLFVRECLLRSYPDSAGVLHEYQRIRSGRRVQADPTNPYLDVLRLAGVVQKKQGHLRVRNRIYRQVFDRQWVRDNLPDEEARRQRIAERRGMVRATALSSVIILVTGRLALEIQVQKNVAERNSNLYRQAATRATHFLYIADMHLAHHAIVQQHNVTQAVDLLEAHRQEPRRGFEWDYLWSQLHRERYVLHAHVPDVRAVVFSPLSPLVATGGGDGGVKLWHVADGSLVRQWFGHSSSVTALAFCPDATRLATTGSDGATRVWDVATGRRILTLTQGIQGLMTVAYDPQGRYLAAAGKDGRVRIWDAALGNNLRLLSGHTAPVSSVAFSPDGHLLVSASGDRTVRLWNSASGAMIRLLAGHKSAVIAVAYSPDGRWIATGGMDATVKLWDTVTFQTAWTSSNFRQPICSLAFSKDGRLLAVGGQDNGIVRIDVGSKQVQSILTGHDLPVQALAFSPDGKCLASGSMDGTVRMWEAEERTSLPLNLSVEPGAMLTFSPDAKELGFVDTASRLRIFDTETGKPVANLPRGLVRQAPIGFSANRQMLAIGSERDGVTVYHRRTGAVLQRIPLSTPVHSLAWSGDGNRIAIGSDHRIILWDLTGAHALSIIHGHQNRVIALAYSRDGRWLASGSWDHTARVWEVATGRCLLTLRGHNKPIRAVAFSPLGDRLATGGADATVRLWELATGSETLAFDHNLREIGSVCFSSDGTVLKAADLGGAIWRWHAPKR